MYPSLAKLQAYPPEEAIYGRVPAGSVIVSGNLPSADGKYSLYGVVIVKRVQGRTREKASINGPLRGE